MTRVALTTDRFEEVAPTYARVGFEPIWLPCVKIEPAAATILDQARKAAAAADLVVIASARTVDLLWPDADMPAVDVAAVAPTTAGVVEARGGRVVVTGTSGLADLVTAAEDRLDGAVVFPRAGGSDPRALEALRALTPGLQEFEVYRAVPVAPPNLDVPAVAFAAPSAVAGWLLSRDLGGVVVGVIGHTTGAAVARWRVPDVVAPEPSHLALAVALASYLEVSP